MSPGETGDFRTLFWPHGKKVVVLRGVNRRDLEGAIERIDVRALIRSRKEQPFIEEAPG